MSETTDIEALSPGTLVVRIVGHDVALFLREDAARAAQYPRAAPLEVRLVSWDRPGVLPIALLVRLARNDLTTFQRWLNASDVEDLRMLQALSNQTRVELKLICECDGGRSYLAQNPLRKSARSLLDRIRRRPAWDAGVFCAACIAIDRLYPTAAALWWGTIRPALPAGSKPSL